jgi:hypothetical protein
MKIIRSGARANHGQSQIEFNAPKFFWVKGDATITIRQSNVKDFSTSAHHSYTVRITAEEVNELLQVLSVAAASEPAFFEKALEPALKSILCLQHVVAGLKE